MTWLILILLCPQWNGLFAYTSPPPRAPKMIHTQSAAGVDDALRVARHQFAAEVTNGRLKTFDDERAQVVFKTARAEDSDHRPGLMEDDVIASTLRSHIAAEAALQKFGLKVRSESGKVHIIGAPDDAGALAKLIVLALGIDGVSQVRADLPPPLRGKA